MVTDLLSRVETKDKAVGEIVVSGGVSEASKGANCSKNITFYMCVDISLRLPL